METSNSDAANLEYASPSSPSNGGGTDGFLRSRTMRFLQSPILTLLEYSGVFRLRPNFLYSDTEPLIPESTSTSSNVQNPGSGGGGHSTSGSSIGGEVSIRIMEPDSVRGENDGVNGVGLGAEEFRVGGDDVNGNVSGNNSNGDSNNNNREGSSYQRYDIQQAMRWIEQILPFSLLLLIVFIRQHLQGFAVTIFSTMVLFKSNDVLQKQTALKGERKVTVLVGYSAFLTFNVFGIYWWKWGEDLCYPLLMIPPRAIPPFWHAVYIIVVNDIMARQTAMLLKFLLLMYYKNGKGHNFRRQGQMLTLVEYTLLLYRALLPTPVQSFFSAMKALTRKEVHYGSNATPEQVNAAGDLCAICQEKMQAPILLRCKHIFCEDCVSEWFERERTCPLCRALVRAADLKSYGDGSTGLYFQLF
ncbi:ring finger and transmembrane domain-containing protein 2 [Phtheirospermum japonicum]|uniref:Ring finger and transmembrane domain-containing protein 2 n=1 Tax=Phtheirospermum japonicum TaxID=374723 RepID=A0A830BPD0_9LAMI|nr:ring finger and transmembrane domain-containing protein 2 [Phtheirospermum japonicum]